MNAFHWVEKEEGLFMSRVTSLRSMAMFPNIIDHHQRWNPKGHLFGESRPITDIKN
jgi:hypothetical protein